jgi:hypothetical protein
MNLVTNSTVGAVFLHYLMRKLKSLFAKSSLHQEVILDEFDGEFFDLFERSRKDISLGIQHMSDENQKHDIGFSFKFVVDFMLKQLFDELNIENPTSAQVKIAKQEVEKIAMQHAWDNRYF